MSRARIAALTIVLALAGAAPARADITAFIGGNTTPETRSTMGAALSVSFAIIGLEAEYAATRENGLKGAPGLKTGMLNGFVQTPFPIVGLQPYATIGAGAYDETLGRFDNKGVGINVGGGVKLTLVGPLRLRGDYRVIKLGSGALSSPAHRFYVGLTLAF